VDPICIDPPEQPAVDVVEVPLQLVCQAETVAGSPCPGDVDRSPGPVELPFAVFPIREVRLLAARPWVRSLGKLALEVTTEGWRFPAPAEPVVPARPRVFRPEPEAPGGEKSSAAAVGARKRTRLRPPGDLVPVKDRLLYLLQPPLENLFAGRQVKVPFQPYPYQLEGIAFLMPRQAALLADEMGLGKTMQTILALRLLLQSGLIRRALLVCPKPLVHNWCRELRTWAEDLPFEVVGGDYPARRAAWLISNAPLKVVNYELLTRDAQLVDDDNVRFDVVVLDEAQRIKNRESKTAQVVRSLRRTRSWALTGTPIENRPEDLVHLFAFVDKDRIPPETPARQLPRLTADYILRRTKDDVLTDLPPKTIRDAYLELTPAQKAAYVLAEKEGVVRLNALGETITVQHVFELVMRLKQICNFDPLTGASAKLEQLQADLAEVADSGRKAIVFSQWVEPLEYLAQALRPFNPVQFHGKVPARSRQAVLERFRTDPRCHVILMSYGTGSVGLNLQFANYVFLFDRWWNPAVEDQAINRAHRIGQKEPVFVTRFIAQGTIEGRIAEVLERKRQLFNELIEQNGPPPSLGLTEEEIFGLFEIKARPRRQAA
jgi:SNF2 family DNA or RNA helicase